MGNPCNNGGNCTDGIATYTCACPSGFKGADCEFSKQNSSIIWFHYSLTKIYSHYLRSCITNLSSYKIIQDIDDCQSNPCQNDGQCEDGINSFTCHCSHGFIGHDCSISMLYCFFSIRTIWFLNFQS